MVYPYITSSPSPKIIVSWDLRIGQEEGISLSSGRRFFTGKVIRRKGEGLFLRPGKQIGDQG